MEYWLYGIGYFILTLMIQYVLFKFRKNHNRGASSIWTGNTIVIILCVLGLLTQELNKFAAVIGYVLADWIGKEMGWDGISRVNCYLIKSLTFPLRQLIFYNRTACSCLRPYILRQKQSRKNIFGKDQRMNKVYSIRELSELAGVSTRTLRYYDEIGLLKPLYANDAGYRFYGEREAALLQQILFYRERGFELKQIQQILFQPDFDICHALRDHLRDLKEKRKQIDRLIDTVEQTIAAEEGEISMSDRQKFEAFKKDLVEKNEERYGAEMRAAYGNEALDMSNRKMLSMTEEQWERFTQLEREIKERLQQGVREGLKPESEEAGQIAALHKEWLCMTWKKYTPQMHRGLAELYEADERFRSYYDKEAKGCTSLLCAAIRHHI